MAKGNFTNIAGFNLRGPRRAHPVLRSLVSGGLAGAALVAALAIASGVRGAEYGCPAFPNNYCPALVNVNARGIWPPDDAPRAYVALIQLFTDCRFGAFDKNGVHWLTLVCDLAP